VRVTFDVAAGAAAPARLEHQAFHLENAHLVESDVYVLLNHVTIEAHCLLRAREGAKIERGGHKGKAGQMRGLSVSSLKQGVALEAEDRRGQSLSLTHTLASGGIA